jgi:hypothetical protein
MNYNSGEDVCIGDFVTTGIIIDDLGEDIGVITGINNDNTVGLDIAGGSFSDYPIEELMLDSRGTRYYVKQLQKVLKDDKGYYAFLLNKTLSYVNNEGLVMLIEQFKKDGKIKG